MPRMTSLQRKAIVSPTAGLQVYDTELKGYYYYDGIIWDCVSVAAGTVTHFANVTAPHGYLECNGQAISRTIYAELFTAISTLYGVGDGSTTFNVPDLRGEFVRGADNGRGVDAGRILGTTQVASAVRRETGITSSGVAVITVGNHDGIYTVVASGGAGGGGGTASSPLTYYNVRPRNIALMPCIKY